MALRITEECIVCHACAEVCPREAIHEGEDRYSIDAALCTECAEEGGSKCVEACPVDCIVPAAA